MRRGDAMSGPPFRQCSRGARPDTGREKIKPSDVRLFSLLSHILRTTKPRDRLLTSKTQTLTWHTHDTHRHIHDTHRQPYSSQTTCAASRAAIASANIISSSLC